MAAIVAQRAMRFHPYSGMKTPKFASPRPALPLFNSTSLDDDFSILEECAPLMVSNISLSPITPSDCHGDEVVSLDEKAVTRKFKSFRKIRDLCKFGSRRRIKLWSPEEVLESTRISETSAMLDVAPPTQPILPHMEAQMIQATPQGKGQGQAYKGQLKVSIYINSGLLTIHVIQGRHFNSKWKSTCDSYVKVELVPEDNPGCQTDVVMDTNHPLYDEKFSFELLPEDARKRVVISVYHKTFRSAKDEILGSTSFGLNNITSNKAFVNGWYYLLPESVGRRKHLQVSSLQLSDDEERPLEASSGNSPVTYQMQSLLLRRGTSGYGFTVTGGCPAKVCRVDPAGPADLAGLRSGDIIMRINKEKAHTASTDGVARIIRHCTRKVLLDVHRPHKLAASTTACPPYNDLDSSMSSDDDDEDVTMATSYYDEEDKENATMAAAAYHVPAKDSLQRRVTFKDFH